MVMTIDRIDQRVLPDEVIASEGLTEQEKLYKEQLGIITPVVAGVWESAISSKSQAASNLRSQFLEIVAIDMIRSAIAEDVLVTLSKKANRTKLTQSEPGYLTTAAFREADRQLHALGLVEKTIEAKEGSQELLANLFDQEDTSEVSDATLKHIFEKSFTGLLLHQLCRQGLPVPDDRPERFH